MEQTTGSVAPMAQRREWVWLLLGICGAVLLGFIGQRYRIDLTRCSSWPARAQNITFAALYWCGLALLCLSWFALLRRAAEPDGPSVSRVMVYALCLHLAALVCPPFLSDDALFYAATSRVIAVFGQSAYIPICKTLPPDDAFLQVLDKHWRCGTSAYFPGFHLIAWLVGKLAGNSLALHLRLYQYVSAAAMLLTGYFTAVSLRGSQHRPAFGAALVSLSPLAVIEGTMNAHNDALLALGCALLVVEIRRDRPFGALFSLALSVTVKASAMLLVVMYGVHLVLGWVRQRSSRLARLLPWALGAGLVLGIAAMIVLRRMAPNMKFAALIGSPQDPWEYCTRSVECVPRAVLRWVLHMPTAAWIVGLCFRGLGGIWLLYVAWRSQRGLLAWLGTGLLIYYLYLHGWSQSWYLLSLLPLMPWADRSTRSAMYCICVSSCAYYAVVLIGNCFVDDMTLAVTDMIEGMIVVFPPTYLLLRERLRRAKPAAGDR